MKLNETPEMLLAAIFYSKKTEKAAKITVFAALAACVILLLPPLQKAIVSAAASYASLPFAALVVFLFALCCLYAKQISLFLENTANAKLISFLAVTFMVLLLGFTGVFSYLSGWRWLNSDHASEMVLGRLLAEENTFLSSSWYYSTELRLIYQTIFTMPLFKILGAFENWALIRSLNIVLNNLVLIACYIFMMKQFKLRTKWIMITGLFLIIPLAFEYWNIITFGGYYIFFIAQVFCCLGLFIKLVNHNGTVKTALFVFLVFSLLIFVLGAQTIRALFVIHIPLLIVCIYMYKKITDKKNLLLFLGCHNFIAGCAGFAVNCLLQFKYNFYSFDTMGIENAGNFLQKLGHGLSMLVNFFGITAGSSILSAFGFFSIAGVTATFVLFFLVFRLNRNFSLSAPGIVFQNTHFLSIFFAVSVFVNFFIFIFSDRGVVLRYFFPFMVLYIPLAAVLFEHSEKMYGYLKRTAIICGVILFIFGKGFLSFQSLSAVDLNSQRTGHIEYLLNNNLEFGFATFWNANITTELTNGKIEMAGLDTVVGGRTPFRIHLSLIPEKYLDPFYHRGESFLLLTRSEWEMARIRGRSSDALAPDYEDRNYVIIRFPSAEVIHDEFIQ